MNKKIILSIAILSFLSLAVFVSAVQMSKQIENYGTMSGDFVQGDVQLSKGWNLVQGFPSPGWMFGDDIFPNDIKAIYGFNPVSQDYVKFYPNPDRNELSSNNLRIDTLIATSAFWVYSDKENIMEYYTLKPAPVNERRLISGWNFVSITLDMFYEKNGQDVFSWNGIKGNCNFEKIYAWNPEEQDWMPISADLESFDFNDFFWSGMVVKVSDDCKLEMAGSSISAPPTIPNLPSFESSCEDSDGGKNYFVKGTAEGVNVDINVGDSPDAKILSSTKLRLFIDDGSNQWIETNLGEIFKTSNSEGIVTNISYFSQGDSRNSADVKYLKFTDYCYGSTNILLEYSCGDKKEETYECPNGCSNGACI